MATDSQHIIQLLEKYSRREATSAEVDQLLALLQAGGYDETVVSFIETRLEAFEPDNTDDIAFWKSRLAGGAQKITGASATEENTAVTIPLPAYVRPAHRVHFLRKWGWAAASVILLLSIGAYLWTTSAKNNTTPPVAQAPAPHIAPGRNGAVLTLADGSKIILDSLGNGIVADQTGAQVVLQDGKLAYKPLPVAASGLTYNTMTTPKGRQFQLTLPDGTRVWLNAASSLRYPTAFSGGERRVEVTGEAYFEVTHNAQMPFKIDVNSKATVEVLGTHFNVNAYENETAISTTLLEGSVRMSQVNTDNPSAVTLRPGQQAQMVHHGMGKATPGLKVINNADIDKVMAWKNGLFNFEGASLVEVMRQIERWYDIEVAYEKGIPSIEFEGKMTKDVPLKDLLVMLERSDIHFRIDNRKLIVLP